MAEVAEEIVSACRRLDEYAKEAYSCLSLVSNDPELKSFWQRMSAEEARHVAFWKALEESNISRGMTHLLTDADKTLSELRKAEDQARELADKSKKVPNLKDAFILAYRMEFYLLHPAFELFFHLVPSDESVTSPESEYESHISRFSEMLEKHADLSPELELLGDTLHQLWNKNRLLAVESSQDFLTRLLNRRGFKVVSSHLAHLAHRNDEYVGIMMLDLDNFKQLNDQCGHLVGDETLKKVARILKNHVRSSDLVGRYGGEEFNCLAGISQQRGHGLYRGHYPKGYRERDR